ncbi:MAG: DUF5343 domain-containing protein [Rhizobiaceae bacterium]|nr:DUF5343 domain-containing protein [Rhizobiaceae bacterium]
MPVTADAPAPYAPTAAILAIINHHRNKGFSGAIDADVLARIGVSDSLMSRTLYALQVLDLIGEDGKPTEVFEGIRLAPEAEYQQRLQNWLQAAYADALQYVDPAQDDDTRIRDAFRSYKPLGQQARMVTLFTGLFAAAGVRPEREKQSPRRQSTSSGARQAPRRQSNVRTPSPPPLKRESSPPYSNNLPPPLAGLLASLPSEKAGWTAEKRNQFVATFGAVLDFCIPIRENAEQEPEEENEMEDVEE